MTNDVTMVTTQMILGFQSIKRQLEELSKMEPDRETFDNINKKYNDLVDTTIPSMTKMIMDYMIKHEVLEMVHDYTGMDKLSEELDIVTQAMEICNKLSNEATLMLCSMMIKYKEMGI